MTDNVRSREQKQYDLTVTGTGWTTGVAKGIPYQTQDGNWRLKFNIRGTITSSSSFTLTLTGVLFADNTGQSVAAARTAGSAPYDASCQAYNSSFFVASSSVGTGFCFSGDVLLASKPTFMT